MIVAMTKQDVVQLCTSFLGAVADRPFSDSDMIVVRHQANRKWFAVILERNGELAVNLKCDPMQADFLRRAYDGVVPAWHMNKTHWNTVFVHRVPEPELAQMVEQSYQLTQPRKKKKR